MEAKVMAETLDPDQAVPVQVPLPMLEKPKVPLHWLAWAEEAAKSAATAARMIDETVLMSRLQIGPTMGIPAKPHYGDVPRKAT
jgi:hypothetical protein